MAALVIPLVPDVENYTQRTALDGREYLLSLAWNRRDERWRLSISDAGGTPIALGRVLTAGMSLLFRVRDARRPPGQLMVVDTQARSDGALDLQKAADPALSDLGSRVVLVYLDADEVASLTGG